MALTRTTLSSAYAVGDNQIVVASATGFAANSIVRIDQEFFIVQKSYSSGTTIPVRGGQLGSAGSAHVVTASVVVGTAADDWDSPGVGAVVNSMIAGRPRRITSITADNSTVTHAPAGNDHVVLLNGTSVINLTVPPPTTDMEGDMLYIVANGKAAHVVTFTGGLALAGASYDVATFDGTGHSGVQVIATNVAWVLLSPMTGTLTDAVPALT